MGLIRTFDSTVATVLTNGQRTAIKSSVGRGAGFGDPQSSVRASYTFELLQPGMSLNTSTRASSKT